MILHDVCLYTYYKSLLKTFLMKDFIAKQLYLQHSDDRRIYIYVRGERKYS